MRPTKQNPAGRDSVPVEARSVDGQVRTEDQEPRREPRLLDVQRLPDHRDRLFRAAYALCGSREDAEDLVQETYASVLKRTRFVRRDDDLAYLTQVLRNTWVNMYRTRARRPDTVPFDETIDFVIDPDADPGVSFIETRAIYGAIHQLSPVLRDTLLAVDVIGLSYKQAARALGTRDGTIMSRLYRARAQLAGQLAGTLDREPGSVRP